MSNKQKDITLPAFTLPEIVVSLLLIAILFATGSTIYTIINKQASSILHKNSFYADYYITKQALKNDFAKPGIITLSDDHTRLKIDYFCGATPPCSITYLLDSLAITRMEGEKKDTLHPGATIAAIYLLNDSLPLVSTIALRSWYKNTPVYTQLVKHYSAEEIIYATHSKFNQR